MNPSFTNFAFLGAGVGVLTAGWGYCKNFFWRLFGLFVVTAEVETVNNGAGTLFELLVCHLLRRYRHWGNYDRNYQAMFEHVRSKGRRGVIPYEYLGLRSMVFWRGAFPVFYAVGSKKAADGASPGGNGSVPVISLSFLRGTLDLDALLHEAAAAWNKAMWSFEDQTDGEVRRFYIRHVPAFTKRERGQSAPARDVGCLPWWLRPTHRLLGTDPADLGLGHASRRSALDDLIFPPRVTALIEEVRLWRKSRAWYHERGIPWKRGWLLHGRPGTGKTALARAFAEDLDMPIWVYNLSELGNFEFMRNWTEMLAAAPCIALIEDFDAVFQGRENVSRRSTSPYSLFRHMESRRNDLREADETPAADDAGAGAGGSPLGGGHAANRSDEDDFLAGGGRLTFDCLLNMLDGVERNDGVFVIMTTNYIDAVDEALGRPVPNDDGTVDFVSSRPGRIDKAIELTYLTPADKLRMARKILVDAPAALADFERELDRNDRPETPAQYQERCAQAALASFWGRYRRPRPAELPAPEAATA